LPPAPAPPRRFRLPLLIHLLDIAHAHRRRDTPATTSHAVRDDEATAGATSHAVRDDECSVTDSLLYQEEDRTIANNSFSV
jgi:hypothetical protein